MKILLSKLKKYPKVMFAVGLIYFALLPEISLATSTTQVQTKLNSGFRAIQTVLTGIAVIVAVVAAIKVFVKAMPALDDPVVKNEMWKSIGGVGVAVGGAAAAVWIVPWIFNIFS